MFFSDFIDEMIKCVSTVKLPYFLEQFFKLLQCMRLLDFTCTIQDINLLTMTQTVCN